MLKIAYTQRLSQGWQGGPEGNLCFKFSNNLVSVFFFLNLDIIYYFPRLIFSVSPQSNGCSGSRFLVRVPTKLSSFFLFPFLVFPTNFTLNQTLGHTHKWRLHCLPVQQYHRSEITNNGTRRSSSFLSSYFRSTAPVHTTTARPQQSAPPPPFCHCLMQ